MILDPAAAARVEAAFDAAQCKTRAPIVCVLAAASASREAEFLLGACILALAAPLPLLLFTELSAHRIYVAQLLVAILAGVMGSLPPVRRWLTPKRVARSAGHRAALAQFTLRGLDRSQCGALIYVSLAEHYIRIVPAERCGAASLPRAMASRRQRSGGTARRRGDGGRAPRPGRALRRHSGRAVPAGRTLRSRRSVSGSISSERRGLGSRRSRIARPIHGQGGVPRQS